jgi:hypothetical protein
VAAAAEASPARGARCCVGWCRWTQTQTLPRSRPAAAPTSSPRLQPTLCRPPRIRSSHACNQSESKTVPTRIVYRQQTDSTRGLVSQSAHSLGLLPGMPLGGPTGTTGTVHEANGPTCTLAMMSASDQPLSRPISCRDRATSRTVKATLNWQGAGGCQQHKNARREQACTGCRRRLRAALLRNPDGHGYDAAWWPEHCAAARARRPGGRHTARPRAAARATPRSRPGIVPRHGGTCAVTEVSVSASRSDISKRTGSQKRRQISANPEFRS